jgi:hypothetical protein
MKYLKEFKLFEAELETDSIIPVEPDDKLEKDNKSVNLEVLNQIQKNISEYRQKKSIIDNIFKEIEMSDSEIQSELENKVYNSERDVKKRNKYLRNYESLCRLKRMVDKIQESIIKDKSKRIEMNKQILDLKDRLNDVDSEKQKDVLNQQISNSNNFIKKIDSNINSNQSKLSLDERNYADKKRDFDEQMKIEEQRIKELSTSN